KGVIYPALAFDWTFNPTMARRAREMAHGRCSAPVRRAHNVSVWAASKLQTQPVGNYADGPAFGNWQTALRVENKRGKLNAFCKTREIIQRQTLLGDKVR